MNKILEYRDKIAAKLNSRQGSEKIIKQEENALRPVRYWKMLILFSALAFIFLIMSNLYFFWFLNKIDTYRKEAGGGAEETGKTEKERLEAVINSFNKRASEFEKTLNSEPSLFFSPP